MNVEEDVPYTCIKRQAEKNKKTATTATSNKLKADIIAGAGKSHKFKVHIA